MGTRLWARVALVLALGMAGCAPRAAEPTATAPATSSPPTRSATASPEAPATLASTPTPAEGVEVEGPVLLGSADVEEIHLLVTESFPVQVAAVLRGYYRDGCTRLYRVCQERSVADRTFRLEPITVRPADAMCTQALVPFEERVALDAYGLPAGEYTVSVGGTRATFSLDVDNALPAGPAQ